MIKQASLIGLMLVLGALPLATVSAIFDRNGCIDPVTGGPAVDDVHYYDSGGGTTLWESKKDGRALLGRGISFVMDGCSVESGGLLTDYDYEWGIGGARLQVLTVPGCGPWLGHHSMIFVVHDEWIELALGEPPGNDIVGGVAGADGEFPCGSGIVGDSAFDCISSFWGKGPHLVCGVGADGSYRVFLDIVTVDLDLQGNPPMPFNPRIGASSQGCIWTLPPAGPKPCWKYDPLV